MGLLASLLSPPDGLERLLGASVLLHAHDLSLLHQNRVSLAYFDRDPASLSPQARGPRHDHPIAVSDESLETHDLLEPVLPGVGHRSHEAPQSGDAVVGLAVGLVRSGAPLGVGVVCRERGLEVAASEGLEAAPNEL